MRSSSRWVLGLLLAAGCGGDDAPRGEFDAGATADGAPTFADGAAELDGASEPATATALVVSRVGRQMGFAVLTIHEDGTVTDSGVRLDAPGRPRAVAFAADRRTALAAYGSAPWEKRGVLVVSLEPDGSAAEVIQDLRVQGEQSPTDILMTGEGEAVMGLVGPDDPDALLTVRRSGDRWEFGPKVPCSPGPDQLRSIGVDGQALLLRLSLFDGVSALTPIARRADGGWAEAAGGLDWSDKQYAYDLAVASSGDRAYRTYTVRPRDDDPSGLLATLTRDPATGVWSESRQRVPFPDFSLEIALSPADDLVVLFDENHDELETLAIDEAGAITPLADRVALGHAIFDMQFSPWGALVVALSGLEDTLVTYRRGDDAWIEAESLVLDDPFVDIWIAQPR